MLFDPSDQADVFHEGQILVTADGLEHVGSQEDRLVAVGQPHVFRSQVDQRLGGPACRRVAVRAELERPADNARVAERLEHVFDIARGQRRVAVEE